MTPERWEQINDLFQSAVECEPEERAAFLEKACRGDETLYRQVKSLIACYEPAEGFIESPAFEVAPELLTNDKAGAMLGELIGHYRVESLIGVGGMGEVYLARDERLGRKVALKFLPERLTADKTQLSRFKGEARAASALNHPNILTVHEIGVEGNRHFIATEFIDGVTLRASLAHGRINVRNALDIAVQVASALAAAHENGVVHRDIKPENIMLRPDGYVKVLDFGIAKLTEQRAASDDHDIGTTTLLQTHPGLLLGTARYMSPEQIRGQSADARSDIWSLGVVVYEMVGGVPPFSGASPSDCIASVLKTEPPALSSVAPDASAELQAIVNRALRKNRDERYQTIAEMLTDLRSAKGKLESQAAARKIRAGWPWAVAVLAMAMLSLATLFFLRSRSLPAWEAHAPSRADDRAPAIASVLSAPPQIPEKSIAVLPFENRSGDPDNAFFTDGVQDEILTDLAKIADLKVISRTSVMQYKTGVKRNLRQIANDLGAAHMLEGSVQRSGNRVRVNAQLIDARNDAHLWAQTYDRDLADVFAIQSEIAKTIAEQLQAKLSAMEKSAIDQPPTANITAFDLYVRAKNLSLTVTYNSNARQDLLRAADLLNQAVAQDPSFFQAYCQLALTHGRLYFYGFDHTSARLALAEAALGAASRLRPDAGETHLARARNLYWGYLDYRGALAELDVARQTLPNDPQILELTALIQRRQGRWEESTQNLERIIEIDPRNISRLLQISFNYVLLRRYRDEAAILDRALAIEPNDVATKAERATVELNWHANIRPLRQMIDLIQATNAGALPRIADAWLLCALGERNAIAAEEALNALGENEPSLSNDNVYLNRLFVKGVVAHMSKDEEKARSAFTAARVEQEETVQAQPNYGSALCMLGLIDAGLGRKEEALREGRRAIELLPVEKDAINGPAMIKYFAMIAAWVGDKDLACEQLAAAIRIPGSLSYGQLKLLPFWDSLRGDPRFEAIVASLAPK